MIQWDEWRGSLDGRQTMWVKSLFRFRGWRLELHKFVGVDDFECFHTHPATALRLILRGGYFEEILNDDGSREYTYRPPRYIGIVHPAMCHRIEKLDPAPVYTLWLRWPVSHKVRLVGIGWKLQENRNQAPNTAFED